MTFDIISAWHLGIPEHIWIDILGRNKTDIRVGSIACSKNVVVYYKTNFEWEGKELGAGDGCLLVLLLYSPA
jgi:hypothetical protein